MGTEEGAAIMSTAAHQSYQLREGSFNDSPLGPRSTMSGWNAFDTGRHSHRKLFTRGTESRMSLLL